MPNARDFFVGSLGTIRTRYKFKLVGYVVMPEHVHLLVSEPTSGNLSVVLKALKHRVSCDLRGNGPASRASAVPLAIRNLGTGLPRFWEPRFYDFNVYTEEKRRKKLQYMHANPVKRGLVDNPASWIWSSSLFYELGLTGIMPIDPAD